MPSTPYVLVGAAPPASRRLCAAGALLLLLLLLAAVALLALALPRLAASALSLWRSEDGGGCTCVFLHGAGNGYARPPLTSDPGYWGSVDDKLSGPCAEFIFMFEDTLHRGWTDERLQRRVCDLVTRPASESPRRRCTTIFAHSMGSLALAGALQSGLCALGEATAWYSVGAPWEGTEAAEALPELCGDSPPTDRGPVEPVLRALAKRVGFCDSPNGSVSSAYRALARSSPAFAGLRPWLGRVNGSMCGDSPFGLWSINSVELRALASWVNFSEKNDAVVPLSGCPAPAGAKLSRDPRGEHYLASVNHYDLTCRHGDGWWGKHRKPCTWYRAMAERAAAAAR